MNKSILLNLKNTIFPPFSEMELLTFFYLFLMLFIQYRVEVVEYLIASFIAFEATNNAISLTIITLFFLTLLTVGLYLLLRLGYMAITKSSIGNRHKIIYAYLYYLLLSFSTIISLLEINSVRGTSNLELLVLLYLFFKNFGMLLVTLALAKVDQDHIYANQMSNQQLTIIETLLVVVLSTVIYLILNESYAVFSTLTFTFFYVTTLMLIYRRLVVNHLMV